MCVPDIVRQSSETPTASGWWSRDDRTMCTPSWDFLTRIGRFPDGSLPTPLGCRLISWKYFCPHRLRHRPISGRLPSGHLKMSIRCQKFPSAVLRCSPDAPTSVTLAEVGTSYGRRLICDLGITTDTFNNTIRMCDWNIRFGLKRCLIVHRNQELTFLILNHC